MGKGCLEAIYGLMGWKGLTIFDEFSGWKGKRVKRDSKVTLAASARRGVSALAASARPAATARPASARPAFAGRAPREIRVRPASGVRFFFFLFFFLFYFFTCGRVLATAHYIKGQQAFSYIYIFSFSELFLYKCIIQNYTQFIIFL